MKSKALLVILTLMVILVTGCNENSIKQINRDVLKNDKFISVSIRKAEKNILTVNIVQRNKNVIKNINMWYDYDKDLNKSLYKIIQNDSMVNMYYIEGIYKDNKWYLNEWGGETTLKKRDQYTMDVSFEDFINYRDFQESPRGTAIKHNKIDVIKYNEKKYIGDKSWRTYNGKFDLTRDPFYRGKCTILFSKNNKTVFEFYDIAPTGTAGKVNYYRRFWYGDDVELVLNDENDDFAEIFEDYFRKAQFDLFIDKIRNIEQ